MAFDRPLHLLVVAGRSVLAWAGWVGPRLDGVGIWVVSGLPRPMRDAAGRPRLAASSFAVLGSWVCSRGGRRHVSALDELTLILWNCVVVLVGRR